MRKLFLAALVTVGGGLIACGTSADDSVGSDEANHTEGELVWSNSPFQWADVDRDTFEQQASGTTVNDDKLVAPRLQAWVDRYDAIVRQVVKEKTKQTLVAPKPRIRLVLDPEPNAFIQPIYSCLATVAGEGSIPDPPPNTDAGAATSSADGVVLLTSKTFEAMPVCPTIKWTNDAKGIAWFNDLKGGQLTKTSVGFDLTIPGVPVQHTPRVSLVSTAPFVNVHLGLITSSTEKEVGATLAHELGHYYRTHSTTSIQDKYDFWYDRDEQLPERPQAADHQEEYRRNYALYRVPRFVVPGQKHHPRFGSTLVRWARDLAPAAGSACEEVPKAMAALSDGVKNSLLRDQYRPLTRDAKSAYLTIEKAMDACMAKATLSDTPAAENPDEFSRSFFLQRVDPTLLAGAGATVSKLIDYATKLEEFGKSIDAQAPAFFKRLQENKIGLYTDEQEADEIGLELATRIGLTADEMILSEINLSKLIEKLTQGNSNAAAYYDYAGEIYAAQCEALYKAGFKENGADVHVPVGIDDPHHNQCYRAFNMFRENKAHAYKTAKPTYPQGGAAWSEVQAQAQALLDGKIVPPPGGNGGGGAANPPATGTPDPETPEESPAAEEASNGESSTKTSSSSGCSVVRGHDAETAMPWLLALVAAVVARSRKRR